GGRWMGGGAQRPALTHSHSIVAGGFDEMSYTTRFTPWTSLVMRLEMRASSSCGSGAQSAVIASRLVPQRRAVAFSLVRLAAIYAPEGRRRKHAAHPTWLLRHRVSRRSV